MVAKGYTSIYHIYAYTYEKFTTQRQEKQYKRPKKARQTASLFGFYKFHAPLLDNITPPLLPSKKRMHEFHIFSTHP